MQSISDPINRFQQDASWFTRARELKLLFIRSSGDLRSSLLKLLPAMELHYDNRSPWIVFEDSRTDEEDGWQARTNRLVQAWEKRREQLAEEGLQAPALPSLPAPASNTRPGKARPPEERVAGFARTASALLRILPSPQSGLVVVLAPSIVENVPALEEELGRLLASADLKDCRFVLLLDADVDVPKTLLKGCGPRALTCECIVDSKSQDKDLEAMLAQETPLAGPRGVVPPRRIDDPPDEPSEERDAALRAAGINPAFVKDAPHLRKLVFGAALAMKQGRGPDAVRLQREAKELAERLEMHQVRVICQMTLASYLSGLGQRDKAVRELEDAVACAEKHALLEQASQAYLALGLLHALGKKPPEAAKAYSQAAKAATAAKVPLLAIEAWRLAGQIALQMKAEPQAVSCFKEAIGIAQGSDPQVVQLSSAPEAARRLATVCHDRGLAAQAASLFEQADQMERGEASAAPARSSSAGAP
ncbi:tetratricopeptide repeat protein [Hyalangium gracile]|uniref:tetratricopeptide repeat protein n=1 Tax=Hyalangium gracile TaxID=394092 RepID=UPI001CCDE7C1|nr:tetratricopeptide repeat protein [Hyalangium gracile]